MTNKKTEESNEKMFKDDQESRDQESAQINEAAEQAKQVQDRAEEQAVPEETTPEEDRRDAEAYRELMKKQREYEDSVSRITERWRADSERLRAEVPDFDLAEAVKDEEFKKLIISGMSVDGAYYALKYKELTGQRRPVMQNANSRGTRSGSDMNDIMSLDGRAFRKKINKMMNS